MPCSRLRYPPWHGCRSRDFPSWRSRHLPCQSSQADIRWNDARVWKPGDMQHNDDDEVLRFVPRPTGPGVADPAALAVGALVIGTLSLAGLGLLNGANYIYPLTDGMSSAGRAVLAGLLGAAFALAAVVMGSLAGRRTHPGNPVWVSRIAQAGVLLAGVAFVLRLVATAIAAVEVTNSGYSPPL